MFGIHNQVAIVGTGWSRVARRADVNLSVLAVEACERAAEDAGLTLKDIDGIATFPSTGGAGGSVEGIDTVGVNYLGRTLNLRQLKWCISLDRGTVAAVLAAAIDAVAVGACDCALVWKAMHNPHGAFGRFAADAASGDSQFTAPYGLANAVATFALPYSRYMAQYGATREHLATFIVNNRKNASMNPDAVFYQKPITADDYLRDKIVADPLSVLDCDMPVDGCGALVLTRSDRAKDLRRSPAYVTGYANLGLDYAGAPVLTLESFMESATQLGQLLWRNSGLRPSDVNYASLYDGFSYFVLLWLEALGFCKQGEAFEFIQDGRIEVGGELPLNTSGGALGMGRLHGMPQLVEGVRQVQGLCGPRQISNVNVSLAQAGSPNHVCALFAFSKEPL